MLLEKIQNRKAKIGIIGLGYVGLPLVREFHRSGFQVTGFDVDDTKVNALMSGTSYIKHIPSEVIREMISDGQFQATVDFPQLTEEDAIIICVPTPLNTNREPEMTYVFDTTRTVAKYMRKGQLIVLESTTYPGTTDEDMRAILENTGLLAGQDFYLAFSPEREDPNNSKYSTRTIPKVVGGYTPKCLEAALALYNSIIERTVPVSSTRVAEATKLLENIFRAVNIALVNEMKILFDRMGIDVWEVINAAATKPFGYTPFYPGPGLGGHCIPIDPFYLTWKAREYDFNTRFIELAGEINTSMPYYVIQKTMDALNERGKSIKGAKILVLGIAYKKDIDDPRESPSFKVIELYQSKGAIVDYNDPYVPVLPKMRHHSLSMKSTPLDEHTVPSYDAVVILTDHSKYDYKWLYSKANMIIDTRNAMQTSLDDEKVVKA